MTLDPTDEARVGPGEGGGEENIGLREDEGLGDDNGVRWIDAVESSSVVDELALDVLVPVTVAP